LQKIKNCADNYVVKVTEPDHPVVHIKQIVLSGEMEVANDIVGPMELHIETKRCYHGAVNTCIENLPDKIIGNLCEKFDDRNDAFWTPFFDGIIPKLGCPIKKVRRNHWLEQKLFKTHAFSIYRERIPSKMLPSI
jgi:hypothetical protein